MVYLYLSETYSSQFHLRSDLLIRESGSFAVLAEVRRFFIPPILAQNDLRRFAALEPGFSLDGFVVTASESFEPGLAAR